MTTIPGKGAVLKLSIASVLTAIAQLRKVRAPGMKMGTVETTDLADTWDSYIATILRGGEVTFTVRWDTANATHAQLWTDFQAGTVTTWNLVYADTGATLIAWTAIMTDFPPTENEVEGIVEVEFTMKVTGAITLTP